MGTNRARIDKSIENILKGKNIEEAKLHLPEITSTIKTGFIEKEISEQVYQSIIGVVSGKLSKIYDLDEDKCKEITSDFIKREQWINEIMELVEQDNVTGISDVLLKALKIALGETVKAEQNETYFVEKLLYEIIFLSLENTMQGTLETLEEGITIPQIRKEFIKPLADKLFEEDIKTEIPALVLGKTTLAVINNKIADKLKNFGGF
ncbi:hypothetical protein B4Q30_06795 [Listeria monocytogenes]|nr:hypothetical protein [Listeria monocytogenes]EAF6738253.1 hypothetical protein [Listeria monocytogenes]EAG2416325.1 hypothetical protein [Listeria monocytogenes]EAG6953450.1 hypothetical protein [Listeria monocytogenes]ECQ1347397.1 hypothetical protein [Listeria monocytogenes]